jgi:putative oxidoreductase
LKIEALRARVLPVLERASWVGPLALRLSLGAVFLGTGWGKLHNLPQFTSFLTELGIPFAAAQAPVLASIELVGGALILLGLFTRLAALPLMGIMIVAILTAKRAEIDGVRTLLAFDEFTYLAGFLWLFVAGAGKASLDALLFRRKL